MSENEITKLERFFLDPTRENKVLAPPASGPACANIRTALRLLDYDVEWDDKYDAALAACVREFQKEHGHPHRDGQVGSGTRRLLVEVLLRKIGPGAFKRMKETEEKRPPVVFVSYTWLDSEKVEKVDQWLRDHEIQVLRDNRDFIPGMQLPEMIRAAVQRADKVIAVYSEHSKSRDWPRFEREVAEQKEAASKSGFIIYLLLDDVSLPAHDPNRIYVKGTGRILREIGEDLLQGVLGQSKQPPRIPYDEDKML